MNMRFFKGILGQVTDVFLIDLDQAQALTVEFVQASLTNEDLPVPREPVSKTLFAGFPEMKFCVLSRIS